MHSRIFFVVFQDCDKTSIRGRPTVTITDAIIAPGRLAGTLLDGSCIRYWAKGSVHPSPVAARFLGVGDGGAPAEISSP